MLDELLRNYVHLSAFVKEDSEPVVVRAYSSGFELCCRDGVDEVDIKIWECTRDVRAPMSRWCEL